MLGGTKAGKCESLICTKPLRDEFLYQREKKPVLPIECGLTGLLPSAITAWWLLGRPRGLSACTDPHSLSLSPGLAGFARLCPGDQYEVCSTWLLDQQKGN